VTPCAAINSTVLVHWTGLYSWRTSASRMASGVVSHFTSTLFTTGIVGALKVIFCNSSASFSAAGFISAQWDGTLTGSGSARLAPPVKPAAPNARCRCR
ncbi:hypothetical protein AZZ62_002311, partial [Klebsiella variicola]